MSSPSSMKHFVISVDERGHLEDTPCTWAPTGLPETNSAEATAQPEHPCGPLSPVNSISSIEGPKSEMSSPVTENFPPLYLLPNRSTHNYEDHCCKVHGKGTCHCEPGPEMFPPPSRRHTISEPKAGPEQRPPMYSLQRSWTMEDQKRLQHMRFIYHEE